MANVVWSKDDILTLLEAYSVRHQQFNIGNFRPLDWDYVLISVNSNKQPGMLDKSRQQVKNKMENMKKKYKQEKGSHIPGHPVKWSYFNDMDRIFGNINSRVPGNENSARDASRDASEPPILRQKSIIPVIKSEEGGCSPIASAPVLEIRLPMDSKESEEVLPESTCLAEEEEGEEQDCTPRSPPSTSVQVENVELANNSVARRCKKRRHSSNYSYHSSPAKALAGAITKFGELCTQLERDRAEREERRQKENAEREERILKVQMDMQLRLAELFALQGQHKYSRAPTGGEELKQRDKHEGHDNENQARE